MFIRFLNGPSSVVHLPLLWFEELLDTRFMNWNRLCVVGPVIS